MEDWLRQIPNLSPLGVRQRPMYDVNPEDWRLTSSGLAIPKGAIPKPKPTHIDLFAGAGGFGLGVTAAGFRTIAANDFDVFSAMTYMYNLCSYPVKIICPDKKLMEKLEKEAERWIFGEGKEGKKKADAFRTGGIIPDNTQDKLSGQGYIKHHPEIDGCPVYFLMDVRELTGDMILEETGMKKGEVDLITGGPPCQGFSVAGRREIMDPRNSLVFEMARLITEVQPKSFVFENVPGITSMVTPDGEPVIDKFCQMLEDGGYQAAEAVKKMVTGDPNAKMGMAIKTVGNPRNRNLGKKYDEDGEEIEDPDEPKQLSMF